MPQLTVNHFYRINGFTETSELSLRFCEMGCIPGVVVRFVGQAPLGGPLLFALDSQTIAVRASEAKVLKLEPAAAQQSGSGHEG